MSVSFEIWLETQPQEIREALKLAFQYGRIEGLDTATAILRKNLD